MEFIFVFMYYRGMELIVMFFISFLIKYLVFFVVSIYKKLDFRYFELKVISEKCDLIFKL